MIAQQLHKWIQNILIMSKLYSKASFQCKRDYNFYESFGFDLILFIR